MTLLTKCLFRLLYWLFMGLGIHAAYTGRMEVALFFAITCAGESIGVSIDYWPRLAKFGTVDSKEKGGDDVVR